MEISNTCIATNENYPWMIMIHGFGGTKNTWKHQVDEFQDYFNLMLIELPGHGETHSSMSDDMELGFDDIAEAVLELMHSKGIEKAHFMCVSLGTLVLASIVKYHPEAVESAVMCGAVFGMAPFHKALLSIGKFLRFCVPYKLTIRMFAQILMPLKAHKKSRKFLVRECFNLSKEEFMRWYKLLYAELNLLVDNIAMFKNIKSLVVMGSEDHVFMKVIDKIQPTLKKYFNIEIINECGHVCCLQKWRDYNDMVRNFYNTLLPPHVDQADAAGA